MARLKRDTYRDSVELMRLSAEVASRSDVRQFSAMMATPANLGLLRVGGLLADELAAARPNDLCLAAEADDATAAEAALDAAERMLEATLAVGRSADARMRGSPALAGGGSLPAARSLRGALVVRPDLNLALISVPGEYAASEARRVLRAGLNVMIFSDNVPEQEEVALKEEAERFGLLCMGPDCGTALIRGVPLGFANRVRRGRIGLVGASGTGLQTVTCQIHQLGEGVSHALGSGGRDLSAAVGGRTTLAALAALADDPSTEVLVIISKPGDRGVEARVLERALRLGKPLVVHFLGQSTPPEQLPEGNIWAGSLEETARAAVALATGETLPQSATEAEVEAEGRQVAAGAGPGSLAGLFVGGTLAVEAARFLSAAQPASDRTPRPALEEVEPGPQAAPGSSATEGRFEGPGVAPGEVARFGRHVIVDLGDDVFTRGKPHPIIDPATRARAIEQAAEDGASVLLLDVVLGFGVHPDPAGALAGTLERARAVVEGAGRRLEVLAAVVGTDQDPQPASEQIACLRSVGVRVYDTPSVAARVAAQAAAQL